MVVMLLGAIVTVMVTRYGDSNVEVREGIGSKDDIDGDSHCDCTLWWMVSVVMVVVIVTL